MPHSQILIPFTARNEANPLWVGAKRKGMRQVAEQGTTSPSNGASIDLETLLTIDDCWEAMGDLAAQIGELDAAIAVFDRSGQAAQSALGDEHHVRAERRRLGILLQRIESRKSNFSRQERRAASETASRRLVEKLRAKVSPDVFSVAAAEVQAERQVGAE